MTNIIDNINYLVVERRADHIKTGDVMYWHGALAIVTEVRRVGADLWIYGVNGEGEGFLPSGPEQVWSLLIPN